MYSSCTVMLGDIRVVACGTRCTCIVSYCVRRQCQILMPLISNAIIINYIGTYLRYKYTLVNLRRNERKNSLGVVGDDNTNHVGVVGTRRHTRAKRKIGYNWLAWWFGGGNND